MKRKKIVFPERTNQEGGAESTSLSTSLFNSMFILSDGVVIPQYSKNPSLNSMVIWLTHELFDITLTTSPETGLLIFVFEFFGINALPLIILV